MYKTVEESNIILNCVSQEMKIIFLNKKNETLKEVIRLWWRNALSTIMSRENQDNIWRVLLKKISIDENTHIYIYTHFRKQSNNEINIHV